MSKANLLPQGGFNRCVRAREGYVLYNPNDIYVGQAIERYGEYGEHEAQLLRQICRPGSVAVEAGAHIGTLTLALAHSAGPKGYVYAYEAQRILFQTVCANLALNSIVNVDARHAAVGAEAGSLLIPDIDYTKSHNFGGIPVGGFNRGRRVPRVALDADLDLGRLDLIKIDVEGMELDVLRGAAGLIQRFRPVLYVENDRVEKSEELIRHLMQLDYRLFWHMPPLYNPENFFGETENVYRGIVSLNMLCLHRARKQAAEGMTEITDPKEHPIKSRENQKRRA